MEEEKLYRDVRTYAETKKLKNTCAVLDVYENILNRSQEDVPVVRLRHGLRASRLLTDLRVQAQGDEEDTAFAAMLCRGLTGADDKECKEVTALGLDPRVAEIVHKIGADSRMSESEKSEFYERIQEDRGALLVLLADRAAFLSNLHELPLEESRRQVRETRNYFFNMCIYAMENFPELSAAISLLRGEIKSLCEVYDILTDHFKAREQELSVEILRVREDNAGLRTRIAALKKME